MKKTQRNFAVEYKSGRRKFDAKPNSIWGNMDLKSVARDVEDEAMPSLLTGVEMDVPEPELSAPLANPHLPLLTPAEATPTTAEEPKGMIMADDTNTINDAEAPVLEEAPVAVKKQRKPRAKKIAVAATTAESATDGPKKRGRKPRVSIDTTPVEPAAPKLAPKAEQITDEAATSAGDEMADLLRLEAENQKLRKMLAEKLRAENADLRKKLNLD